MRTRRGCSGFCADAAPFFAARNAARKSVLQLASSSSLGRRPTFYEHADESLLEASLLDFDGDLYGELAKVRIAKWIRAQVRFPSVDKLVAQLERDVEATRKALA